MSLVTSQRLALEIVRFGESSPLTALKRVERGRYPGLYIAREEENEKEGFFFSCVYAADFSFQGRRGSWLIYEGGN